MGIVDWIYPKVCVLCGIEGEYICQNCLVKMVVPEFICPICCKSSYGGWVHELCRSRYGLDRLIVGLPYKGGVQGIIKNIKYKNAWDSIEFLTDLSWRALSSRIRLKNISTVVSVPMHIRRQRERGFNQAQMIARLIANKINARYYDVLRRSRETKPMYGLSKNEREENVRDVFTIDEDNWRYISTNSIVILIDDVWTTGSTMRACTRILKECGAGEVWGLAIAR